MKFDVRGEADSQRRSRRKAASVVVAGVLAGAVVGTVAFFAQQEPRHPAQVGRAPIPHPSHSLITHGPPVHVPGIELGPVPVQGVAIQQPRNPKGVVFIDLEGHVLRRLPEFGLFRTTLMPSVVAVTRGGIYYRLRPSKGSLDPIASRKKAYRWFPDSPTFEGLPAPQWHGRDALGAWSWAMRAPDGSAILAQWSGECESPTAFLAPASGGAPVSVTGERFGKAAESMALGWTANSEAVVILPNGACGSGVHTPGVYLFDAPGQGRLIFATTGYADARMWNSAGSLIVEPS